jgi:RNA polymerase subunit RPABC4/transcription elongation factor Spt4
LLVLLVLGIIALRRSRAHRRELAQFEEAAREAHRIATATLEMRQQQAPQARVTPVINKALTPRSTSVPEAPRMIMPPVQPIAQPLAPQSQQAVPIQQAAAAVVKEPGMAMHAQTVSDLRCPNCQRFVRADATYCPNCRYQLSSLTSHLQSQAIVAPPSVSHGSSPSAEISVPQSQAALVEVPPGNPAIEARLRRLWSQPG